MKCGIWSFDLKQDQNQDRKLLLKITIKKRTWTQWMNKLKSQKADNELCCLLKCMKKIHKYKNENIRGGKKAAIWNINARLVDDSRSFETVRIL
jgi:hypothetical protein